MKIGLVVAGGFDRSGRDRVTPVLLSLVGALARRHDVRVFVLDYYKDACTYRMQGATIHDLGRARGLPGTRRFEMQRRLAAILAGDGRVDVLHAYQGMPAGIVAATVATAAQIPLVATIDSGELVRHDDIDYGLQRRFIDRRAVGRLLADAQVLTVTTDFMRGLSARHGVRPLVVPLGIDPSAFPLAERREGPPWRLIRVASINRVKDYPTLLAAFSRLIDRLKDVHLDIVGEDTLDGAMQALARRLEIDHRVTFHGLLPSDDVARLYARAHVNVVSSRHEAACSSVLEAAATGLATVGTAVGYVADWTPNLAVAVPVLDPAALGQAIGDLILDKERRDAAAGRARAWVLDHDVDWTVRRFEQIYDDVLTQR
jgi:glycosyltransferase involved in cell wall biosynthesis